MSDLKDRNKPRDSFSRGGGQQIPKRLVVWMPYNPANKSSPVSFPHTTIKIRIQYTPAMESRFNQDGHALVAHLKGYSEDKKPIVLETGVLCKIVNLAAEGETQVAVIELLTRVELSNIFVENGIYYGNWQIIKDVNPSVKEFQSLYLQEALQSIKMLAMQFASFFGIDPSPVFELSFTTPQSLGKTLDQLSDVLFHKFVGIAEIKLQLANILEERMVRIRVDRLLALLLWVGNDENAEREMKKLVDNSRPTSSQNDPRPSSIQESYERKKDALPEYVRNAIERWLPYAEVESETGRIHAQYIEWLLELPWTTTTEDEKDFSNVREKLEKDHYGLQEVKGRILDFLAIRRIKPDAKAAILCFVGPPGVGKTSLGRSIAEAMGRKFIRRSLGGLKDEAELRGHRRTYIGSLPGLIIEELRKAGSKNPVFMLDEIDKLGQHGKDTPELALLEILDPQQNSQFNDHYIDIPFDLSEVLFILTANTTDTIHEALLNRMEVIELPGYTEEEKITIAQKHIIPNVKKDLGLEEENLKRAGLPPFTTDFSADCLRMIVSKFVDDAGMRDTEKMIAKVSRKILRDVLEGRLAPEVTADSTAWVIEVTAQNIKKYLGEPALIGWIRDLAHLPPGVAPTLMVTRNGIGVIGSVEATYRPDAHLDRKCTGSLKNVLEESIEVALSRLIHCGGILEGILHKIFIHFHFPNGATEKDGPSAGIEVPVALYSALLRVPVKPRFAATGEITLARNTILPVGRIHQKLLAAEREGLREVVIPLANRKDLDNLPEPMRQSMLIVVPEELPEENALARISREPKEQFTVYCLDRIEEVLAVAFPDHFPPPEGFIERFNAALLEKLNRLGWSH